MPDAPSQRRLNWLFAATIFLGAFLLFQVQPLIGKAILPWFGGGPAVWTTSMLFFQVLLLAGYAYADLTHRLLSPRNQAILHAALLGLAAVTLPVLPGADWKPVDSSHPQLRILALLSISVGLPYFVLSTTAPLVQSWFARSNPAGSPYRLYALSNVGSLLALLSYPFVVEPMLPLGVQNWMWSGAFAAFALLCATSGVLAWRRGHALPALAEADTSAAEPAAAPSWEQRALWLALPAVGSALYLGVTNVICQDVAVFPLLWIVPLALYLVSFILCFDGTRWYRRDVFIVLAGVATVYAASTLAQGPNVNYLWQLAIYLSAMFFGCMVCHGELVQLKPAHGRLTEFYLCISAGGALGGLFAGVVAPNLFVGYYEFHVAMLAAWLAAMAVMFVDPKSALYRGKALELWGILLVMVAIFGWQLWKSELGARMLTLTRARNFYGVLAVANMPPMPPQPADFGRYELRHGKIVHGAQFIAADKKLRPLRYYSEHSGIGLAFRLLPRTENRKVGVVGLGVGTLAVYGKQGDEFRFYEINPEVLRLTTQYFSYLQDTPAKAEVLLGDARLVLERESPQNFDLLVLDAFSGDSIPIHLMTREAFATYLGHLSADGILAVHISSLHLDLAEVLKAHARHFGLTGVIVEDVGSAAAAEHETQWVLLARNRSLLQTPLVAEINARTRAFLDALQQQAQAGKEAPPMPRPMLMPLLDNFSADAGITWTDDYSNVLSVMK